jgi:NTP pyrophosphatase (non-canonical NTP hydrolase)
MNDNDTQFIASFNALAKTVYENNKKNGFWLDLSTMQPSDLSIPNTMMRLMLIVTELAEAAEGVRKNLRDDHLPSRFMFEVELADAVIRILDIAGGYSLDLGTTIMEKIAYNTERQDHKLANRLADGGKKA